MLQTKLHQIQFIIVHLASSLLGHASHGPSVTAVTNLSEAEMMWWQWHQLDHMQKSFATRFRQITMPSPYHLCFYGLATLPATQPTVSKHYTCNICYLVDNDVMIARVGYSIFSDLWMTNMDLFTYYDRTLVTLVPSVLWRCWLGVRKSIWPIKIWVMRCWHGYLLEQSANSLHMVQLICCYLVISASAKARMVYPFNTNSPG